jgi:PAS domain S-box-containing protein
MKYLLSHKLWLAFGFAMLPLLLVGLLSYRWMVVSDESDNWVRHTHEVMGNIQDLALTMERIESASRGFVLAGDESDLDDYQANISRAALDQAAIRTLTADNSAQQIHFPDLELLVAQRIRHADMLINLRRNEGLEAAVDAFGSATDKQNTEFQALMSKLQDEEVRLRTQRVAATRQYVRQTKTILLFGTLLGLLIVAAAVWASMRNSSTREIAEARYRGLLEAAPDAMVVVNQSGEIVLLNVQAEKQFGYSRDELLGQKVTNIIPEGFAERLIADSRRTTAEARAQQIGTGIELQGRRRDGTMFPLEIMLSPLESPEGLLVTSAIRDISARKQLEEQLRQSQKMEAIGQLTGGIAHDFNNLLGVILGNLDLLDRLVAGNDAALQRVRIAQKAAMRGADITRRLLMFSSIEVLEPSVVFLKDSIQNMIELAGHAIGAEIKLATRIDGSVPPLFVDPTGLESALLNLVVNARDAMPEGGSITIASEVQDLDESHPAIKAGDLKAGRYALVSVSDTGQGMSRKTLGRAFEPFFTTKPRNKGTGLGLAMVYGFAKQSGGIARVYSELGHGTTVSIYLPLAADLSPSVPPRTLKPLSAKLSGTVLVVDDEVDLLDVALAYLAEMGFTSYRAIDGASALQVIAQHSEIDLMVTDIVMPGGMNGAELAKKALALRPGLKVIYSSGFPLEALEEKRMPLMDGPLLHKPYQRAEFDAIIYRVMEGSPATSANEKSSHSTAVDKQIGSKLMGEQ